MKKTLLRATGLIILLLLMAFTAAANAEEKKEQGKIDDAELAKMLANPLATLITVPFQYNLDFKYGPLNKGERTILNIQPVIPFSLGSHLNLITRTIVPLVGFNDVMYVDNIFGLGDIMQSFFIGPKKPIGGLLMAAGPVLVYPTASDPILGGGKWCAGPTLFLVKQQKGWTAGLLANHLSSFAGDDNHPDVQRTLIQPVLSYTTSTKTTIMVNTEANYDWEVEQWTVPLHLMVSQLIRIGKVPFSVSAGGTYWAETPKFGPEGFGVRGVVTFILPGLSMIKQMRSNRQNK